LGEPEAALAKKVKDMKIDETMIGMEKHVSGKVLPKYRALVKVAVGTGRNINPNLVNNEMLRVQSKYKHLFATSNDCMKVVADLFKKYGIA
jgi:hypothetical protein